MIQHLTGKIGTVREVTMSTKMKTKMPKEPALRRFGRWLMSHKLKLATFSTLVGLYSGYANFGVDSLRTDIYQPLYREINVVDDAVQANILEKNYSSESYETIRKNGNLLRVPKSLRDKISHLYRLAVSLGMMSMPYRVAPASCKFLSRDLLDSVRDELQHGRRTAKQKQDLLASNLPRNSRPKLIRPMNGERSCEVPFLHRQRAFRGRIDFSCLGKRKPVLATLLALRITMDDKLTQSIRENYNRLAEAYARQLFHELENKPLDRQLLDRFATETAGRGEVCDMGCGTGHVARYLSDAGANVCGLDLSPDMIDLAKRLNPKITFRVGNMLALDLASGSVAGIAAFYAIVNIPRQSLPLVFKEMLRVLQPDGLLLLAFHAGDETVRPAELWGQPVSLDWFFFPVPEIQRLLEAAGFTTVEVIERDPYPPDVEHQSRRAYIFARRLAF